MRVDVANGERDARAQTGKARGLRGQHPRELPELADLVLDLIGDETREVRIQGREEVPARVGAVLVDALVAGGARVAEIAPAELPDDPVRGLHPVPHRGVDLGVLLEELQAPRELPL